MKDSKAFNIFVGSIVRNWIPTQIEFYKLDTHPDLTLFNGIAKKYVTNILVVGLNHLKLFALFEDDYVQQLCETKIMDNIRCVKKWEKSILVETEKKIFGLAYEDGAFKTIYMLTLQFLNLPAQYKSFVRTDYFSRYCLIIANQHLIICFTSRTDKDNKFSNIQFQKVEQEVAWNKPSCYFQFMYSIYTFRLNDIDIHQVLDVDLDVNGIYLLIKQNLYTSIYSMRFQRILQPRKTALVQKIFTQIQSGQRLIALNPETQSSLLLLSSDKLQFIQHVNQIYIFLPIDNTNGNVKIKTHLPNLFYVSDHQGIHQVKVFSGKMEKKLIQEMVFAKDFNFAPNNRSFLYMTGAKVALRNGNTEKMLYRYLNTILDFHNGSRNILAIQRGETISEERNKIISIKRFFKPMEKTYMSPKRTTFQNLPPVEHVKNLYKHQMLAIKIEGKYELFSDKDNLPRLSYQKQIKWVGQFGTPQGNLYLVLITHQKIYIYHRERIQFVEFSDQFSYVGIHSDQLLLITTSHIHIISIIDTNHLKLQYMRDENVIASSIHRKEFYFKNNVPKLTRLSSSTNISQNHLSAGNIKCYLLFLCYKTHLEIFEIDPSNKLIVLKFKSLNIHEGPAYLHNHLMDPKEPDRTYLRSITDQEYISEHHYSLSEHTVCGFLVSQVPANRCLVFRTSNNQFYIYKFIMSVNDVGFGFRRVILPLYATKYPEGPLKHQTPEILRFGNRVYYHDVVMEITETFHHCFKMGHDYWILMNENKLKMVDLKGDRKSGKLVNTLGQNKSYIGIQSSTEYYCAYARDVIQLYDKDFNSKSKIPIQNEVGLTLNRSVKQEIISLKMSHSFLGISSYQHFQQRTLTEQFESFKFLFTLYDINNKHRFEPIPFEQAVVGIKFLQTTRVLVATSSFIFICQIKQNKLEMSKTIHYSQRAFASSVGVWTKHLKPCFLLIGSIFGGLSFCGYDEEKLAFQEKWFEPLKCGVRQVQIFYYGKCLKGFLADQDKNIIVLDLKDGGMEKVADFCVGSRATKVNKVQDTLKTIQTNIIYTSFANGSIKVFVPIKLVDQQNSLLHFQHIICEQFPYLGGLNDREYRKLKQTYRSYNLGGRGNMLEYDTMEIFMNLSKILQKLVLQKSNFEEQEIKAIIVKFCSF